MSAHSVPLFRPLVAVLTGLALLASTTNARAGVMDPVFIGDSESPGMFTGSVQVTNQLPGSATITITLTNTSPSGNGGFLTGLAFNDPNKNSQGNINNVTAFTPSYTPPTGQQFTLLGGPTFSNTVPTSPYGSFDIGAAVGGDWLGGGAPSDGLAVGETGTFVFQVTGSGLTNLSAATLMAAMSTKGTAGFAVRFRGFNDGSSDKDIAGVIKPPPPPPPPAPIPAPPGLVLAGMGFGCLLLGRLRSRRSA
jgi:hypothetical protein